MICCVVSSSLRRSKACSPVGCVRSSDVFVEIGSIAPSLREQDRWILWGVPLELFQGGELAMNGRRDSIGIRGEQNVLQMISAIRDLKVETTSEGYILSSA